MGALDRSWQPRLADLQELLASALVARAEVWDTLSLCAGRTGGLQEQHCIRDCAAQCKTYLHQQDCALHRAGGACVLLHIAQTRLVRGLVIVLILLTLGSGCAAKLPGGQLPRPPLSLLRRLLQPPSYPASLPFRSGASAPASVAQLVEPAAAAKPCHSRAGIRCPLSGLTSSAGGAFGSSGAEAVPVAPFRRSCP